MSTSSETGKYFRITLRILPFVFLGRFALLPYLCAKFQVRYD
jgi:hypothetical protein